MSNDVKKIFSAKNIINGASVVKTTYGGKLEDQYDSITDPGVGTGRAGLDTYYDGSITGRFKLTNDYNAN